MAMLRQLVENATALILDFDGPVCSVFSGYPPDQVAAAMNERGVTLTNQVPSEILAESDPMEILSWSASTNNPILIEALDEVLTTAEYQAVLSAETTIGIADVIHEAVACGMSLAIASNNSVSAINRFMMNHRSLDHVGLHIGRPPGHPELMKPNPHVLTQALQHLNCLPDKALFVGDSLSDITAARSAGMPVIAYANKESKIPLFRAAQPDAVILSMRELAEALSR